LLTFVPILGTILLLRFALWNGAGTLLGYQIFSKCNNGVVDPGEQCDDGNLNNHDGCSTGCQILSGWACAGKKSICHESCGYGTVERDFGEECDDQNAQGGDGCSRTCLIEKGWACTGEPSHCRCATTAAECGLFQCGDHGLNPGEECDNGATNGAPDDPCNANCSLKKGFACKGPLCYRDLRVVLQEQEELRKAAKMQ
jgi:cysteine-rich repeat protein